MLALLLDGPINFDRRKLIPQPDARVSSPFRRTVFSLYDMISAAKPKPIKPVGQLNTARIVIRGTHGEHWLNRVRVVHYDRTPPEFRAIVATSIFTSNPPLRRRTRASRGADGRNSGE